MRSAEPPRSQEKWSFCRDGHRISVGMRPFALEIFCGSARLTKNLRQAGLDAYGADWRGGRLALESPAVLMFNLTLETDQRALRRLLQHPFLIFVHLAPPCGT